MIQVFENKNFGSIRTIMINNEPWFVAKDVALALGYKNPQEAVRMHCDGFVKFLPIPDALGRQQDTAIIPEKGLYRLIMRSNLPNALKFQDWVCDVVIPSIRKHGGYIAGQETMTTEETLAHALLLADSVIKEKQQRIDQLQKDNLKIFNEKLELIADKAILMHTNKTYTATEIAKEAGLRSANELNALLEEKKIQFMSNCTWVPYAKYSSLGYFSIKQTVLDTGKVVYHRKITDKGREFILKLLRRE